MSSHLSIRDLVQHHEKYLNQKCQINGWVRSARKSKRVAFVTVNDGSTQEGLQVVFESDSPFFEQVGVLGLAWSVSIEGVLVASQGQGQVAELKGEKLTILGQVDEDYPLQKKATSLEFLRQQAHLRPRTNTFGATFRIRHQLSYAVHQFYHERGFYNLHSPIITASDCEGAGAMFQVTTLPLNQLPLDKKAVDFSQDFFGRPAYLTVSGQLSGECFAMALGKVYTFGPTFRAENSNTARRLAEFWMIEPEVAFCDLEGLMQLAQDFLQFLLRSVLNSCVKDLEFLQGLYSPGLIERLQHVSSADFVRVTYTKAVEILKAASTNHKFEYIPVWGQDLQTEHERYLTEVHFKLPVIVTDYPKDIKSFYMKLNPDGKTVRAMDVLVPGIGEIIGGSQREENLDLLKKRVQEMGLKEEDYWWYLDLRRFGSAITRVLA